MTPVRLDADSPAIPAMLALIRESFAYMEGRIDPPSSMHRLTESGLRESCAISELWITGSPPQACVMLTPKGDALYIGKLAVSAGHAARGLRGSWWTWRRSVPSRSGSVGWNCRCASN